MGHRPDKEDQALSYRKIEIPDREKAQRFKEPQTAHWERAFAIFNEVL
jgi:hypothetical protein